MRGNALDPTDGRALALRHDLPDARLAVLTDLAGVDAAFAAFEGPGTEIVCEPGTSDIVSLLVMAALAAQNRHGDPMLHDTSRETEAARIEQLSEEVRRLAMTIDRLTRHSEGSAASDSAMEPGAPYRAMAAATPERSEARIRPANGAANSIEGSGALSHAEIRALLRARRLREQFLDATCSPIRPGT